MPDIDSFNQLRDDLMNLYEAGDYATALELVEKNESKFPEMSARTTFWKMCLLSLEKRLEDSLSIFRKGMDDGLWWAESQFADTDLDSLRGLAEFRELVARSKERWEQERTQIEQECVLILPETEHSDPYPLLIVLHGRNGNKESNLEYWNSAKDEGWAILSPQSTQPLFPGSHCWDDPSAGVQDILFHLENTLKSHEIDREQIVIAGFSQGSGMALYTALQSEVSARGFIGVGTWWAELESIRTLANISMSLRCYFISGEEDFSLERSREIQTVLRENGHACEEEMHAELGHKFPSNFEKSFQQALEFILEE